MKLAAYSRLTPDQAKKHDIHIYDATVIYAKGVQ